MRWLGALAIACVIGCAPPTESQTAKKDALAQRLLDRFVEPVFESFRVETRQTLDCEGEEGEDARQCQEATVRFNPVLEDYLGKQRTIAKAEMSEITAELAAIIDTLPDSDVAALEYNSRLALIDRSGKPLSKSAEKALQPILDKTWNKLDALDQKIGDGYRTLFENFITKMQSEYESQRK